MTTKKKHVSLLLIFLVTVCLLTGVLFGLPKKTADTVYASRDSNGTNTDGEWTGTQDTPNLIPILKDGSIATQGWKVGSDGNTKVAANAVHESNSLGWVIKSSGNGTDLGAYGYTGGVYYTLTLSEADRVKANAGQLYVSGEAGFYVQMWAKARYSIRVEFYNSGGAQIGKEGTTHEGSSGWGDATDTWGLGWIKVPVGTCTIQVWFSNHNTLDGRPYIANPSCSLHDITPPSDTGLTLESPNTSGVIAGDTIRYCIGFNEKVSISSKGTATITLNGTSYNSTDAVIETVGGKSKACYTFKLPDVNQSGTIKLSSVSGLVVKDEAGNTYTYNNSNPSVPTQQYYKTMNVSCSPAHLKFSGGGTAKFNHDYTATLSAVRGYNLPETITVKVGSKALSQGSDFTYDSRTGAITIKGALITDDIVVTASGVPKKNGVTLHKESGVGGSESTTATFDAPMPAIDVPTRTGYTFQGYFTASGGAGTKYYDAAGTSAKNCDFDVQTDLYAYWTANHYTIQFDSNKPSGASGTVQGSTPSSPRVYDEGEVALPQNNFTLTGWTFKGWAADASSGTVIHEDGKAVQNLTDKDGETVTLYAVWKANEYTVKYHPNKPMSASNNVAGSTVESAHTYDTGRTLTTNGFSLMGWTFEGWSLRADGGNVDHENGAEVKNLTERDGGTVDLYAVWKQNTYTILFDSNIPENASSDVKGNTPSSLRTYDEGDLPLPQNEFTLTGWTFQGWAAVKGNGVTYDNLQAVGNLTPDPNGSVTLYAVWKAHTHKITLNATGGNNAGTLTATYDDPYPDLTLPEKYGYTFLGYYGSETESKQYYMADGNAAEIKYTIDDDITLYAHWSPITYTIWLYSEGSYIDKIENVVYGVLKLPSAEDLGISRKNFDFVGWNVYAEQNWKMYNSDQTYDTGLTGTQGDVVVLNAAWEERPVHSIYFDANGGLGAPAATQAHEGETITLSETVPSRSDHTFLGWATYAGAKEARYQPEGEFTMGSDAVTLYAVWKHNPSLTYNANGGKFNHSVAVTYPAAGTEVTLTDAEPVKEGHTFVGWATEQEAEEAEYFAKGTFPMPETDTVLYAVWQKKDFTVSTSVAESCNVSGLEAEYPYGKEVTFTVTGDGPKVYVNGTRIFGDGSNYTFTVTENVSIVIADSSSCVLLYSANGGEEAPTDTKFYASNGEATVSTQTPTRTGYRFVGWSENKEASPKSVSGRSARIFMGGDDNLYQADDTVVFNGDDVTLYAIWEANTYTVKYNGMDAEGSMTGSAHSYGTPKALEANAFTKTGYNFVGWALSAVGTPVFADGDEVLNLTAENGDEVTLYAVWEKMKTEITFDAAGGGGGSASYVVEYGDMLPVSGIMAPVYNGYTFGGYFTEENGAGTQYFAANMYPVNDAAEVWTETAQKLTLHAYWIPTTETLEKSVDEVQANLFSAAQNLKSSLDAGDANLQDQIDALIAAYQAADEALQKTLQGEDSRIESSLQGKIDSLQTQLDTAKQTLNDSIDALEKRLNSDIESLRAALLRDEATIADLQKALTQLEADYKAADTAVRADFAAADKGLQANIDALGTKLTKADETLDAAIKQLRADLEQAVVDLEASIATNREELDQALKNLQEAYEAADALINNKITDLQNKDSELTQSIADLNSKLTETDERLQDAIEQVQTNLDNAKAELLQAIQDNEDDIEAKVAALDAAYQDADRLLTEKMENADSALGKRIDDAINDLTTAMNKTENDLKEAIDNVQTNLNNAVSKLEQSIAENRGELDQALEDMRTAYEAADRTLRADMTLASEKLENKMDALETEMNVADAALRLAINTVQKNLNQAALNLQAAIDANETDIEAKVSALGEAYQAADALVRSDMATADKALETKITALGTAMNDADSALQTAIEKVQSNLDSAVENLQAAIDANEADIEAKVSALDAAYQAANVLLRSDMTAADEALETKITALGNAMIAADSALQTAIEIVQNNLDKAAEELRATIDANETDIEAKVAALDAAYQAANALLRSDMTAADEALEKAMNDADSALQTAIEKVQSNLDSAVENLQAAIDANETDIEAKVSALDAAYQTANTLLRSDMTAADEALEKAMNDADSALQTAIETVQTDLDKAVENLQAAIDANETDIESKISALDSAYKAANVLINSDIAGLKAQDSALSQSIAALDYAYKAADEALWAGIRQVEEKHDALEQESEKTALTYTIVNTVLGSIAAGLIVTLVVKAVKKKRSPQ